MIEERLDSRDLEEIQLIVEDVYPYVSNWAEDYPNNLYDAIKAIKGAARYIEVIENKYANPS